MLSALAYNAKAAASRTARKAALSAGAVLALIVGMGFMTVAAWLVLVPLTSAAMAALILGAFYCGFGFILIAIASLTGRRAHVPPHPVATTASPRPREGLIDLVVAFLAGMSAGKQSRS